MICKLFSGNILYKTDLSAAGACPVGSTVVELFNGRDRHIYSQLEGLDGAVWHMRPAFAHIA